MRNEESTLGRVLAGLGILAILTVGTNPVVSAWQRPKKDVVAARLGHYSFNTYCMSCHGKRGKGDGALASSLQTKPADLTQFSNNNAGEYPFENVRELIDGRQASRERRGSVCPVWGDAFQTTDDEERVRSRIYELTHYLWSIQEEESTPGS